MRGLDAGASEGVAARADPRLRDMVLHVFVAGDAGRPTTGGSMGLVAVEAALTVLEDAVHIREPVDGMTGAAARRPRDPFRPVRAMT